MIFPGRYKHAGFVRPTVVEILVVGFATAVLTFSSWLASEKLGIAELREQSGERLALYANSFDSALNKFDYLPFLLSQKREIVDLLRQPRRLQLAETVNRFLERTNTIAGSADLYVMDAQGKAVAASNYRRPMSFIGHNYAFRPYFKEAVAGGEGRYFAIGVTTGRPGYFRATAIRDAGELLGVAVVKVNLNPLQSAWVRSRENVIVSDENHIAFLASREGWRYRSLVPMTDAVRARIATTRQYEGKAVDALNLSAESAPWEDARRISIEGKAALGAIGGVSEYLARTESLAVKGWHLHYLADLASVHSRARQTMMIALLLCSVVVLLLLVWRQRQQAIRTRLEGAARLEEKVRERTRELENANQQLMREVQERKRAEDELREAQAEIVETSRLAAMGQISAAVAHELNQPLSAIRTYAASAGVLLDKQRAEEVRDNLVDIRELTDRMARISDQLRMFARKSDGPAAPVAAGRCIARALHILEHRLRSESVEVQWDGAGRDIEVVGEEVRIEQVMVNLIRNAMDAVKDSPSPRIMLAVTELGGRVRISVEDNGTGIPDQVMPRLFEAFYTTKSNGEGLGLGLALSYGMVRQLGGEIRAENRREGGARLIVELPVSRGAERAVG